MPKPDEYVPNVGRNLDEEVDDVDIILGRMKELNRRRKELEDKQKCAPGFAENMRMLGQMLCKEVKQLCDACADREKQLSVFTFQEVA